jgi:hypothetical protein
MPQHRAIRLSAAGVLHRALTAHARRKLYDVFESTKSPIAEEALKRIGELYKIEAEITGQSAETRLAVRRNRAAAILDALRDWLTARRRRLSSKNALAKAIQYALSRWEALTRYAGDGRLGIDNNVAERALRGIAIAHSFCPCRAGGGGPSLRAATTTEQFPARAYRVFAKVLESDSFAGARPGSVFLRASRAKREETWSAAFSRCELSTVRAYFSRHCAAADLSWSDTGVIVPNRPSVCPLGPAVK